MKHEIVGRVHFISFSWDGVAGRIYAASKSSLVFTWGSPGWLNKTE